MSSSKATSTMHTSSAPTGTGTMGGSVGKVNVIDHIIMRHRELEKNMTQLQTVTDPDRRKEILQQVTHDLSVHAAVEELVLYSTVKRELGDLDPDTFTLGVFENLEEHHAAKTILSELNSIGVKNERFQAKARILTESVMMHIKKEEEHFLPEIQKRFPKDRLMELGDEFMKAEKVAPTRPHPKLPDEGKMAAAASGVAATFDKMRDAVTKSK